MVARGARESLDDAFERTKPPGNLHDALRDSEARLAAVLRTEVDAVVVFDELGVVESVNPAVAELFGYTPEEVVSQNVSMLLPNPYRSEYDSYLANYRRSGEAKIIGIGREVEGRTKDGSTFPMYLSVSEMTLSGRRMFTGVVRNLTELRSAQNALLQSESTLKAVLDTAVDTIVIIDQSGVVLSANCAFEQVFGYTPEEVVGKNVSMLMPEPYRSEHDSYLANYLRIGEAKIIGIRREVEALKKDGTPFPADLSVSEVKLGDRHLFTGILRDISERKAREEQLRRSEERFRSIFENKHQLAGLLSPDGVLLEANRRSLEFTGTTLEDVIGKPFWETKWWNHSAALQERLQEAISEASSGNFVRFEAEHPRADGEMAVVDFSLRPVQAENGKGAHIISESHDISELKEAQKELVEKESLAKLGELSAIIAHEVKNPLAGIISAARMLKRRLPEGADFEEEVLDELISRTQSLNEGVHDVLSFARPRTPQLQAVPLSVLLDNVVSCAKKDPAFERMRIASSIPELTLSCDPQVITTVFLNLLLNATQAMDGEGTIAISAANGHPCAKIIFSDSGPGIPEATLKKIFEPFFTTKGGGTGLGLPIAKRTIELHGGTITIDCPPEGGTRVVVGLPTA